MSAIGFVVTGTIQAVRADRIVQVLLVWNLNPVRIWKNKSLSDSTGDLQDDCSARVCCVLNVEMAFLVIKYQLIEFCARYLQARSACRIFLKRTDLALNPGCHSQQGFLAPVKDWCCLGNRWPGKTQAWRHEELHVRASGMRRQPPWGGSVPKTKSRSRTVDGVGETHHRACAMQADIR